MRIRTFITAVFLMMAGLSTAKGQAKDRPNILFAIMDDATWLHMSAYGCQWVSTPAFDRVAAGGLLFNRAYTPNAKCAPSRSNILTGRNSWQLKQAANHWPDFPSDIAVFTEALAANGYRVGFTGKGWAPGYARHADGSNRQLLVSAWNSQRTKPPTTGISNIDYAANFEKFLGERKDKEPFFFWYGGNEPHRGYEYRSGITKGHKNVRQVPSSDVFRHWPDIDSVKEDLLDYAYEIEYFDSHLEKMLRLLKEKGELDNTLVVVTSDNGMPFPRVKGQAYEYSNHLPLAMMWKAGISAPGRRVDELVSFIDFAPTFLEIAGVHTMIGLPGQSLTGIFANKSGHRSRVLIGKERHDVGRPHDEGYPIRGIVKGDYLYLRNFKTDRWPAGNPETGYLNTDGGITKTVILDKVFAATGEEFVYWEINFGKRPAEELYNIKTDPDCMQNLAAVQKFTALKKQLGNELFDALKAEGDPRMSGHGDVFDHYPYMDKGSARFYERTMRGERPKSGWVNPTDFQDVSGIPKVQESLRRLEKTK